MNKSQNLLSALGFAFLILVGLAFITDKTKQFEETYTEDCVISEIDQMNKTAECIQGSKKVEEGVMVEEVISLRLPNKSNMLNIGDKIEYSYPVNPTNGSAITDEYGNIKVLKIDNNQESILQVPNKNSQQSTSPNSNKVLIPARTEISANGSTRIISYNAKQNKWGMDIYQLDLDDITGDNLRKLDKLQHAALLELIKVHSPDKGIIYKVIDVELVSDGYLTSINKPGNPFNTPLNYNSLEEAIKRGQHDKVYPKQNEGIPVYMAITILVMLVIFNIYFDFFHNKSR